MLRFILLVLFCASFSIAQNSTIQGDLRVKGGHVYVGTDTILHNVGIDANPTNLSGSAQIGIYSEPKFNSQATSGGDGIRVRPRTTNGAGHLPYLNSVNIFPPVFGTASGAKFIRGLYINSIFGSDSGNYAIYTNDGLINLGDTTTHQKLTKFRAAIEYKGRVVNTSGRVTDSDYVVLADASAGYVADTLPQLFTSIGRQYIFIQYPAVMTNKFKVMPYPGEKIETYDSIAMNSNIGISKLVVINRGDKWSILEQHEENVWGATLGGVSGTVTDTAWVVRDFQNFFIRIKPLTGTSNATSFTISGANSQFTQTDLDTTYTATQTASAWNNSLPVAATCVMSLATGSITCLNVSSGFAVWTAAGVKGTRYGLEFNYRLPKQPSY